MSFSLFNESGLFWLYVHCHINDCLLPPVPACYLCFSGFLTMLYNQSSVELGFLTSLKLITCYNHGFKSQINAAITVLNNSLAFNHKLNAIMHEGVIAENLFLKNDTSQ